VSGSLLFLAALSAMGLFWKTWSTAAAEPADGEQERYSVSL